MNTPAIDQDVLIIGAGPVGLFLANECARRGLRFRIVESRAGQSEHSKALAIYPRTLEVFDMAGVVEPFLRVANRTTSVAIFSHGRRLAGMQFTPDETPYSFIAMVPQDITEKILAEELVRRGSTVEYETTFVTAVQHDDRVAVTLDKNGQREELTAAFAVGCDGSHSAVRHLLNLPFDGAEYKFLFLLADITTNEAFPGDEMQLCPNEAGPIAIFPMSSTRRRIVATIEQAEGDAPSLDLVRRILKERGPTGMEALALHWTSYFRIHHRHVSQLRVQRMFVAGDAAHIHSPFGGQGMNTGLQDAWNLAWKLDLATRGYQSEVLLDSYTAERLPVIKGVIQITDLMTKAMGTPSKFAQALRDMVIPMVSRLAPFQHAFVQKLGELDIAYRGSPIVAGAGKRYFDDSLRGGKGILSRYLLVLGSDVESSMIGAATELAGQHADLVEIRMAKHQGVMLVRPDGYIAYSGGKRDGLAALESVRSLLSRHTKTG